MLKGLKTRSTLPWVCGGDFNEILFPYEKWGGGERKDAQMAAVYFYELEDMGYQGLDFTWVRTRASGLRIRCQLDWVLANQHWQHLFMWSRVVVRMGLY